MSFLRVQIVSNAESDNLQKYECYWCYAIKKQWKKKSYEVKFGKNWFGLGRWRNAWRLYQWRT